MLTLDRWKGFQMNTKQWEVLVNWRMHVWGYNTVFISRLIRSSTLWTYLGYPRRGHKGHSSDTNTGSVIKIFSLEKLDVTYLSNNFATYISFCGRVHNTITGTTTRHQFLLASWNIMTKWSSKFLIPFSLPRESKNHSSSRTTSASINTLKQCNRLKWKIEQNPNRRESWRPHVLVKQVQCPNPQNRCKSLSAPYKYWDQLQYVQGNEGGVAGKCCWSFTR